MKGAFISSIQSNSSFSPVFGEIDFHLILNLKCESKQDSVAHALNGPNVSGTMRMISNVKCSFQAKKSPIHRFIVDEISPQLVTAFVEYSKSCEPILKVPYPSGGVLGVFDCSRLGWIIRLVTT